MARERTQEVSEKVHKFLSRNGKMGGATTKRLIELGKQVEEDKSKKRSH